MMFIFKKVCIWSVKCCQSKINWSSKNLTFLLPVAKSNSTTNFFNVPFNHVFYLFRKKRIERIIFTPFVNSIFVDMREYK